MAASQALYRKWRSQTFGELVGQEHVVQTLRNAIRSERIGHAYLLTGPRGVGKTTVARLVAKAVNCESPVEARPCDRCEPCRSIADGRAVDVIEMDAASHTGVDDAREIIERVQFRPTSYRVKVYLIDEVHMLSTAAFNALLKTLEEPPPHVLFILATTEFHKVPATIVSRCQRFVFTRHSVKEIAAHLQHVAQEEQTTLEPGVAEVIARAATGAMRDALSVLDQLMAGSDGVVMLEQAQALLGATASGEVLTLIAALADGDLEIALRTINEVADGGADLRQFARDLVDRLRSLMLLAATDGQTTLDLSDEAMAQMRELAGHVDIGRLVSWLKVFSNLDYQLKNSPYGQLPLELAVVELLTAQPQISTYVPNKTPVARATPERSRAQPPAAATAQPVALPTVTPQPPAGPATPPEPEPETIPPVADTLSSPGAGTLQGAPEVIEVEDNAAFLLEEIEALWPRFLESVLVKSRVIHGMIQGVKPINVEEQTVVLLASYAWQQSRLEQIKERKIIEDILSKVLQRPAHIRVTVDTKEAMPDARKQVQHARNDPLVRAAINIFDAELIGIDTQ